jgi:2,3-bisphosphoglycerate-independent phosphoglycerate mutase
MPNSPPTPVLLLILDGFGYREATRYNAIAAAKAPYWRHLWRKHPHTTIQASASFVGLPEAQMGNSEVGHLNIGGGRIVMQDLTRIDRAIDDGSWDQNPVWREAMRRAGGRCLHLLGLLSDGGVHSHHTHFAALLRLAARSGVTRVKVHAFLDGRDTPPRSAATYIEQLEARMAEIGVGEITSICGRYYAMDRDRRWERVAAAYRLVTEGVAEFAAPTAASALAAAYARGESDEFVRPSVVRRSSGSAGIEDGDVLVFLNFRADRARQLTQVLCWDRFDGFERIRRPRLGFFCSMSNYGADYLHPVAFAPMPVRNSFGEYIAKLGHKQFRIAETEKYPHVTYFFNGGEEQTFPGEVRELVPSPKVATYDLQPQMSAPEVTERLLAAIRSGDYQALICNYANCDMVGHTGVMDAAVLAVECVDACVNAVVEAMRAVGGEVLITADHGNVELMFDDATGQPHTAHTDNPVPLVYVGRPAQLAAGGSLRDIAPTLLHMMGLPRPDEMSGHSLLAFG